MSSVVRAHWHTSRHWMKTGEVRNSELACKLIASQRLRTSLPQWATASTYQRHVEQRSANDQHAEGKYEKYCPGHRTVERLNGTWERGNQWQSFGVEHWFRSPQDFVVKFHGWNDSPFQIAGCLLIGLGGSRPEWETMIILNFAKTFDRNTRTECWPHVIESPSAKRRNTGKCCQKTFRPSSRWGNSIWWAPARRGRALWTLSRSECQHLECCVGVYEKRSRIQRKRDRKNHLNLNGNFQTYVDSVPLWSATIAEINGMRPNNVPNL